ncbi:MAG: hypothetical protein O7C59_09020, partial [Rickettsia endosymbiont of Ixodes persulcatus]|nr:hypothetical protein [Rickettsia endosymbiont of Ixodes persulcatus]
DLDHIMTIISQPTNSTVTDEEDTVTIDHGASLTVSACYPTMPFIPSSIMERIEVQSLLNTGYMLSGFVIYISDSTYQIACQVMKDDRYIEYDESESVPIVYSEVRLILLQVLYSNHNLSLNTTDYRYMTYSDYHNIKCSSNLPCTYEELLYTLCSYCLTRYDDDYLKLVHQRITQWQKFYNMI